MLEVEEWFSTIEFCFLRMGYKLEQVNLVAQLGWSCILELQRWVMTFSENAENE